jgi:hypothetical protein
MRYAMIDSEKKQGALETLRLRQAEIEAAIERLEADDEAVLLEPAAQPDF